MPWPFRRRRPAPPANTTYSISDAALVEWFQVGARNYSGVAVSESSAMALSAVFRAVALIAGTIAGLPLRSIREVEGKRTRTGSVFDDPGGVVGLWPFNWKELVLAQLLLHGNAFLEHRYNVAGGLAGLAPIHPLCVNVVKDDTRPGMKRFDVTYETGRVESYDRRTMTHVMGLSLDGLRGLSVVGQARNGLGTAIAGDRAAAKVFSDGAMHSGIVTPEEDVTEDEAKTIKADLNAKTAGWENAGEIAVVNRRLKFTPWTMSLQDAQFLESRAFQVEEIARWFGVPPHLLAQTDKQTSWGTGVAEQNRGLQVFTLAPWTSRLEEPLSALLPAPRFVEFDYAGLLQPSPAAEIDLLIKQVQAGLMTVNEARRIRNMDPVEGGDVLRGNAQTGPPSGAPVPAQAAS